MKKKFLSVVSLVLVCTMAAASLTGCGTQAKATDQEMTDGETIIVTEEAVIDTEDEIMETEVVGEEETVFAGAENDEIVLYAEVEEEVYYVDPYNNDFEGISATIVAREDIPVYDGAGHNVGYIKDGGNVVITESSFNWDRFKNPFKEADYDYLYVLGGYSVVDGSTISATEVEAEFIDFLNENTKGNAVILDAPTSDMDMYEFVITNNKDEDRDYRFTEELIGLTPEEVMTEQRIRADLYRTFYIECEEDADGEPYILCRIYYKDRV